jgi:hypothetical protein
MAQRAVHTLFIQASFHTDCVYADFVALIRRRRLLPGRLRPVSRGIAGDRFNRREAA